jgi:thiamine biosynthesis lipoprotein ApbE
MKITLSIATVASIAALLAAGSSLGPPARLFRFNYENVLGTSLELKISARTAAEAEKADAAARKEIEREAAILSAWDRSSEFSQWNVAVGRPTHISPELFETLALFDQWRERTGGALDASAEAIVRVWKKAAAENRTPAESELAAAVSEVKQAHWNLDPATQTATRLDRTPIALNSFAKSYIAGRAADAALAVAGVDSTVVNIGGDLVIRGARPEVVDIADPRCDAENCAPLDSVRLQNRAIATSGNYRRGVEIGGKHYSHIVDPRTGRTAEGILSSTVVAMNPADAGAMATAFSVLRPEESQRVAEKIPGAEYLLITSSGQRLRSAGWNKLAPAAVAFLPAAANPEPAPGPAAGMWDPAYELTISVDLAVFNGFAKRPYLAVWAEDANKKPVRTIALWYNKDRYLPEMRGWYRMAESAGGADAYTFAHSVASATRGGGKYTIQWDGKDNSGKLVPAGKYTIYIEAAREHGSYQLLHDEMDFSGSPAKTELKGGTEISGAALDYHKR